MRRDDHDRHCSALLAAAVVVLTSLTGQAQAERRAAIVIGNGDYEFAPLANPKKDAKLIAATLGELDFDVLLFYDLKKNNALSLKKAIKDHLLNADISVLYYAGHGIQYGQQNLLLPVDVQTDSVTSVVADSLRLNELIELIKDDPIGVKLIVLDACRNNPIVDEKGIEKGLAYTEAGKGQVLIAFSTSSGEVAYDGTGVNSPYSAALANALRRPNLDIYDIFRTVRGDVRQATAGAQIPWITGSIETQFVIRHDSATAEHPDPDVATSGPNFKLDELLWEFIKDSTDPSDFERYAKVFPASRNAAVATRRSRTEVAQLLDRGIFIDGPLKSNTITTELPIDAAKESATTDFVFQQAGERAVSETFRVWPRELPITTSGMRSLVTDCDIYAADPVDPQRIVPGVTNGLVNIRDAARSCVYALAVDPQNPRLLFQLGRVMEIAGRFAWAEYYYDKASQKQYSAALTNLGFMKKTGRGGPVELDEALRYYVKASDLGNLRARTNVGAAYIRGEGVTANPEEGILWYRLAASSGWSNAINALADSYRRGLGVKKDLSQAAVLYSSAADGGQIDAMSSLGRAYVSGAGVKKDVKTGLNLLNRATEMGNKYAPYYAAAMYAEGASGVTQDRALSLKLYELSSQRGFEDAYLALALGWRDGIFSNKPDVKKAYFNASMAARFKVDKANVLAAEIGAGLKSEDVQRLNDEVELFVRQNGL